MPSKTFPFRVDMIGNWNVARIQISAEVEESRDQRWQREGTRQVETPFDAERFVERVGFAACLTDARRPGPSLYVAVCGRRDAIMPRNVQKDPEASHTWHLKDELARRGKVYYGKLAGARHVHRPSHDSVLPCGVGHTSRGRIETPESYRQDHFERPSP